MPDGEARGGAGAGRPGGGSDGLPDGWLRYVVPTEDTNRSRWPVHPAWEVIQRAFTSEDEGLGPLVRERIREKNIRRGLASVMGYLSTLSAWVGGDLARRDADISLVLHWLYEAGAEYLDEKGCSFAALVEQKRLLYRSDDEVDSFPMTFSAGIHGKSFDSAPSFPKMTS